MADCNPRGPSHWIKTRPSLTLFESRHEDNPILFDDDGKITEQGKISIGILDRLTGVRKERLRYGKWVQAEGQVYEGWDDNVHLIDPFPIPASWQRFRSIDFGYSNPFVCQWWAVDGDGRMYLYREIYHTQRTVRAHADQIKKLSQGETYVLTVADHDSEDRATLLENGIPTRAAMKAIKPGIEAVMERLLVQGDNRPRLMIFRDALVERDESLFEAKKPFSTAGEIECYLWPKGSDGKSVKELPIDKDNHGMDAKRYGVQAVNRFFEAPVNEEQAEENRKSEAAALDQAQADYLSVRNNDLFGGW
jgi:phage terminase large subunit